MRRYLLTTALACLLFAACAEKPQTHLPAEQMQRILFDIHLAESFSMRLHEDSSKRSTARNLDSLAVFYRSVFKRHQVTPDQFEQSLKWYLAHPQELDTIYARMIPEMSKLEAITN